MRNIWFFILVFLVPGVTYAQDYFISGHFSNLPQKKVYFNKNNTLLRPATGVENRIYDSLIFTTEVDRGRNWFVRKIFHEHLVDRQNEKFKILIDPIIDFRLNYDSRRKETGYLNTRGFLISGNLISRIYFNSSFYENQGKFPDHINDFYEEFGVIPGYGRIKQNNDSVFDFANSFGSISFKATSKLFFTLGYDRLFAGDGYRSMILSDFAAPYMFFRANLKLGNFEYSNLISKAINPNYNRVMGEDSYFVLNSQYPSKIISYNFLTYNIKGNWQITLFDAIIFPEKTKFGPIIGYAVTPFIRNIFIGYDNSDPNALLGINLKYQNRKIGVFYGQFVVDELKVKDFSLRKAVQLGYKNFDFININNLYFQAEYNTADFQMYTNRSAEMHYGHQNQTLAHPAGHCFDEILLISSYSLKRFEILFKFNYLRYKKNTSFNLQNIFNSDILYNDNIKSTTSGNQIINLDCQIIYNVNTSNRIQLFAGVGYRNNKFSYRSDLFVNFGLRTAFRANYYDF